MCHNFFSTTYHSECTKPDLKCSREEGAELIILQSLITINEFLKYLS